MNTDIVMMTGIAITATTMDFQANTAKNILTRRWNIPILIRPSSTTVTDTENILSFLKYKSTRNTG
jgi:hypothetical protein